MSTSRTRLWTAPIVLCAILAGPHARAQKPIVPLDARWPARIAVGMRRGAQLPPLTVEARRDGWVIVTFFSNGTDAELAPPRMRLLAQAADVRRWTARVRALLAAAPDPKRDLFLQAFPPLGTGGFRAEVIDHNTADRRTSLSLHACTPNISSTQPSLAELTDLLDLLDTAAMRAGGGRGRPPTLARPYYASEVSCPATPVADDATFDFPNDVPPSERRLTEIGAGFVVDTSGIVERGSIELIPGTDPRLARAARALIAHWRYRPAEWSGTPVRQLVLTTLVFSPDSQRLEASSAAMSVRAEPDGWVHFVHRSVNGRHGLTQEWFTPDTIDAWAARVDSLNAEAAVLRRATAPPADDRTILGAYGGVGYFSRVDVEGKTVYMSGGLISCGGAYVEREPAIDSAQVARFRDAASAARSLRPSPIDPARDVHTSADVACSAGLPMRRAPYPEFTPKWPYSAIAYPKTMAASNARAAVLASFVVDTVGVADVATLRVLPRADPRAVAALAAALRTMRFRPAVRGGQPVPQRVIQPIPFEPLPVCVTPDAAPVCARRYSRE